MKKVAVMIIALILCVNGCIRFDKIKLSGIIARNIVLTYEQTALGVIVHMSNYVRSADTSHIELFFSNSSGFNPTGYDGTSWTAQPNAPMDWDGSSTSNLYKTAYEEPLEVNSNSNLIAGNSYYIRGCAVDYSGNRSVPSDELTITMGGSPLTATLIVAAADASAAERAGADYVCGGDGDDQTEFNLAAGDLPLIIVETGTARAGTSTSIQLRVNASTSDDAFNSDTITIISGAGAGQTRTIGDYSGTAQTVTVSTDWTVNPSTTSVYKIESPSGTIVATAGTFLVNESILLPSNCKLAGQEGTLFKIVDGCTSNFNIIENSNRTYGNRNICVQQLSVDGNKLDIASTIHAGVVFEKTINYEISSVKAFNFSAAGIYAYSYSQNGSIVNCKAEKNIDGISVLNAGSFVINGCFSQYNERDGILVYGSSQGTVSNGVYSNNGQKGMLSQTSNKVTFSGNNCNFNYTDGIDLNGSSQCIVSNNTLEGNGQLLTNTYANIIVGSNADQNTIQGNVCRRGSLANQSLYGIRIGSTDCDRNFLQGNNCYTGGVGLIGAGISDNGSNTVIGHNVMNDGSYSTTPN